MGHHDLSTATIEEQLLDHEAIIARSRAAQMSLLRELDRRQVAVRDGHRSLKEWAAGRMDLASETAGMLVATAWRLEDLPDVDEAVASGVIGFDRAVAVCRFARRDDSCDILGETAGFDIAGIRIRTARRRRLAPIDEEMSFEQRYVAIQPNLDESAWTLSGRLPGYAGRTVVAALEARADSFPYGPTVNPSRTTRNADALWAISQDSITGDNGASVDSHGSSRVESLSTPPKRQPRTPRPVSRIEGGPQVGLNTLQAILCDGVVEVTARTSDGTPLAVGRRTRVIPPRLRRFILHRDGGVCTISGCVSRYRLQVHHTTPWSEGGRTDAENLSTVCWFHHHVVIHGHGFTIDPNSPPQRRRLTRPRIHAPPHRTTWRIA